MPSDTLCVFRSGPGETIMEQESLRPAAKSTLSDGLRMMRDQDQGIALDAPGLKLREEVHPEHVHIAEARRGDDPQIARDDVADAKLGDRSGLRRRGSVGRAEDHWGQARPGVDLRVLRGLGGYGGDGG